MLTENLEDVNRQCEILKSHWTCFAWFDVKYPSSIQNGISWG